MPVKKAKRDIEKTYTTQQMVAKLRRLAGCLEQGKRFLAVLGERYLVPFFGKDRGKQFARAFFVVDNQNFHEISQKKVIEKNLS